MTPAQLRRRRLGVAIVVIAATVAGTWISVWAWPNVALTVVAVVGTLIVVGLALLAGLRITYEIFALYDQEDGLDARGYGEIVHHDRFAKRNDKTRPE